MDSNAGTKKLRAIGYTRVSLDGMRHENQIEPIRAYCQQRGIELVAEFSDTISGSSCKRPALDKALVALKRKEADLLVCFAIDRLSRSLAHLVQTVTDLSRLGIGACFIRENIDTSRMNPASDLLLGIFASLSQYERSLISSRTKTALAVARARGVRLGRKPKLTPELKDQILAMHADGIPIRRIARELSAQISRGSVQAVIRNARNQRCIQSTLPLQDQSRPKKRAS